MCKFNLNFFNKYFHQYPHVSLSLIPFGNTYYDGTVCGGGNYTAGGRTCYEQKCPPNDLSPMGMHNEENLSRATSRLARQQKMVTDARASVDAMDPAPKGSKNPAGAWPRVEEVKFSFLQTGLKELERKTFSSESSEQPQATLDPPRVPRGDTYLRDNIDPTSEQPSSDGKSQSELLSPSENAERRSEELLSRALGRSASRDAACYQGFPVYQHGFMEGLYNQY